MNPKALKIAVWLGVTLIYTDIVVADGISEEVTTLNINSSARYQNKLVDHRSDLYLASLGVTGQVSRLFDGWGLSAESNLSAQQFEQSHQHFDASDYNLKTNVFAFLTENSSISIQLGKEQRHLLPGEELAEFNKQTLDDFEVTSANQGLTLQLGRAPQKQYFNLQLDQQTKLLIYELNGEMIFDREAYQLASEYGWRIDEDRYFIADMQYQRENYLEQENSHFEAKQLRIGFSQKWLGGQNLKVLIGQYWRNNPGQSFTTRRASWLLTNEWSINNDTLLTIEAQQTSSASNQINALAVDVRQYSLSINHKFNDFLNLDLVAEYKKRQFSNPFQEQEISKLVLTTLLNWQLREQWLASFKMQAFEQTDSLDEFNLDQLYSSFTLTHKML